VRILRKGRVARSRIEDDHSGAGPQLSQKCYSPAVPRRLFAGPCGKRSRPGHGDVVNPLTLTLGLSKFAIHVCMCKCSVHYMYILHLHV
jgi:hypothetical protein